MPSYLCDSNQHIQEYENCPVFLERYLEYLQTNRDKRPLTISEAMLVLREFCQFVHYRNLYDTTPSPRDAHKHLVIIEMKPSEMARVQQSAVEEYVFFLDAEANNSPSTIRKKLSILHTFYAYLILMQRELEIGFPYGNPVSGVSFSIPSEEPSTPVTLTVPELHRLVGAVTGSNALRDGAILLTFITTGITLSELTALNRSDFDPQSEWLRIEGRTKNDTRYVYLTEPCRTKISDYLEIFRKDSTSDNKNAPLFSSSRSDRKRLTTRRLRNLIISIGAAAGLGEEVSPRILRDTAASLLMQWAGESGSLQVYEYLGYQMDTRLRNRFEVKSAGRRRGNSFMKQVVRSSPLAQIGTRRDGA